MASGILLFFVPSFLLLAETQRPSQQDFRRPISASRRRKLHVRFLCAHAILLTLFPSLPSAQLGKKANAVTWQIARNRGWRLTGQTGTAVPWSDSLDRKRWAFLVQCMSDFSVVKGLVVRGVKGNANWLAALQRANVSGM